MTPGGAVPLGASRISGGHYLAKWSVRPGVRVNVVVPAAAYAAGALAELGTHVVDRIGAPHGVPVMPTKDY